MKTVECLRAARELIVAGWGQGKGALQATMSASDGDYDVADRADQALVRAIDTPGIHFGNVHLWNDEDGRTQQEVLDVFDRAIALAEVDQ